MKTILKLTAKQISILLILLVITIKVNAIEIAPDGLVTKATSQTECSTKNKVEAAKTKKANKTEVSVAKANTKVEKNNETSLQESYGFTTGSTNLIRK